MVLPDDFLVYEKPDSNKHVYSRIGNNYLFHSREYEPEVGLYYYRNRYYMPRIGRFLQTDPMGYEDSMNLYQAFGMNPVNFTDPFGRDTDAGRIASSLSKYYESIRPKNPDPTWFDRLLGNIFVTYYKFQKDVDNIDTVHFTLQSLYDTGNFLTLGTLEKTAAQKDLDIASKIWYFYKELPNRINNVGTFGLLDNLEAERGNGIEGAGRAVYKTLFDLSLVSNIYTIFYSDASIEEKIRAGFLFPSKIAALALLMKNPGSGTSYNYKTPLWHNKKIYIKGDWVFPMEGGVAFIRGRWYTEHALERMAPNIPEIMAELTKRAL